jgi:hypothetical protein
VTPLLLAPLGLAALAALVVPLLIHLRRRTEEVPVDFAALRWLDPRPRPRRKLRFDELLLLALRLLLIALLALLLAQPALSGWEDKRPRTLVTPGVDAAAAREIAGPDADVRWIAPGFPALDGAGPVEPAQTASLIREFDADLLPGVPLTVLVPRVLDGVDAAPLRLTRRVSWRIAEGAAPTTPPAPPASPTLAVRYAAGAEGPLRYLRAAAQAWSEEPRFAATTSSDPPPRDHVLVWLTPGRVPPKVTDWVSAGGIAVLGEGAQVAMPDATMALWRDAFGNTLMEGAPLGAGRLLRFTRPLVPSAMPELVGAEFPARLRDLITPPAPPPARVAAVVYAPSAGIPPFPLALRELSSWLCALIALIFLAERLLAIRPRRFAA